MPKLETASITQKISLSQIIDNGNIREFKKYGPNKAGEYPADIVELAQSIKQVGQLQPIVLKFFGEENGIKQYEIIAGFRRRAAFQYLCSIGEDYQLIEAIIKTGDKLIIQLVENIQRENLTAPEREKAIFQLAENGLKQNEIAAQLSKSKGFVSINISAYKMRVIAEKEKIDLSEVETSTLSELLSIPEENLSDILRDLTRMGGTRTAAAMLAAPYKKGKQAAPEAFTPPNIPYPGNMHEPPPSKGGDNPPAGKNAPPPETLTPPIEKPKKGNETKQNPPIEAEHRIIDVNIILTVIFDYIKKCETSANNLNEGNDEKYIYLEKAEVAKYILALIHKEIDK